MCVINDKQLYQLFYVLLTTAHLAKSQPTAGDKSSTTAQFPLSAQGAMAPTLPEQKLNLCHIKGKCQ